ncbi:glycosyl hydrolases family 15 [Candidatus Termititenax persephonae]|uniref:Glycosyl hydrolases family 15 n=1 Tax=Candidatus Termititenax persephonae TaxID=2218525 RepID=A0A388TF12_9BACT|nr:glycosyl hydrolases family 15 [Candidatus Termititenax persephonae]
MRVKEFLIAKALYLVGLGFISDYVFAFLSIGYSSGEPIPKVLMDFNILNIVRGLFTRFVVSTNLDWIWPYWMVKQFYATSEGFSARGFNPASINTNYRNWTGIGDLDSEYEATIDPRGLTTPYFNSWSLDTWLQIGDKVYSPAQEEHCEQTLLHNLPIVVTTTAYEKKIQMTSTVFAKDFGDLKTVAYQRTELKNLTKTTQSFCFSWAFRPYNNDGIALIRTLDFRDNGDVYINGSLAAVILQIPNGTTTSSLSRGDVKLFFDEAKSNGKITDYRKSRVGMATGLCVYHVTLPPGKSAAFEARLPVDKKIVQKLRQKKFSAAYSEQVRQGNYAALLQEHLGNWQKKMQSGLRIAVPDAKIQDCFEANKAFMLMFYDNTYITPGPSTYHEFWFRDATYLLNGLDKLGFHQETRNVLNTFRKRILASGLFHSQQGEWDSNGQAIWTLMEHYRLTGDKDFLKENYDIIKRGAQWIIGKAQTNLNLHPGYRNIMPPGLSAEHFGLNDYYYWDDFWSLAGLQSAVQACEELQKKGSSLSRGLAKLQNAVNTSLLYAEAHLGQPIMPISPSRRMDSAAVGCLSAYYPCRVYAADDQRLVNTVKYLQEKCFIRGGFFHDVNHSGYGTYLTMHIAQCYIGQRSAKALEILGWLLKVASPTWCWPEAIHPRTLGGTIGDGHHGWAAADFCLLVRNMLYLEENNDLLITPVVPARWYKGEKISVSKAATYFGELNYTIASSARGATLTLQPRFTRRPRRIAWVVPVPYRKVLVDGQIYHGEEISVPARTKQIQIFY